MLVVDRVTKRYEPPPYWLRPLVKAAVREPVTALDDVSLTVARGEVVGLVGPNGAGKTTLLKIISGLLEPTAGRVEIAGHSTTTARHDAVRHLGLVLEGDQGLHDRLTGLQNLEFYGGLSGLPRREARRRGSELLERLGLAHRDKLVFGYSSGMRMRLSLARALLTDPALLVLDEPTRSLDPVASRAAIEVFREQAGQGRAVLMSNHRLDEVVSLCDRTVVVVHGEVRFEGSPRDLQDPSGDAASALSDLLERELSRR